MAGEIFDVNPDLPAAHRRPGVFTSARLDDPGATAPLNTALVWGYVLPGAPVPPDASFLGLSQDYVNDQAGGEGAMLAQAYAAAKAQAPYGAEIHCMPLAEPSGGTAATHLIKFMARPVLNTGKLVLGSNTAALVTHLCTIYCGARRIASFVVKKDDTFETIATNALAEINKVAAALEIVVTRNTDTLTATDRHKGEHGNAVALRVDFSDEAGGVAASPGTITFANDATDPGTCVFGTHVKGVTATIADNNTPALSAAALRDAINGKNLVVYCAIPAVATGVVTLFYRTGRWARLLSAALVDVTGQTVAAAVGTAGAGTPDLTAALTALASDTTTYKAWSAFWTDATNWGSLSTHIEGQSISPIEKGQMVFGGFTGTLAAVGNFADGTTPKLNVSSRYGLGWYQGSPLHPWQIAARMAAMVAVSERQSWNFNFTDLKGTLACPVAAAPKADRPTGDEINTAIASYGLAPIVVGSTGIPQVEHSRTTYKSVGFNDQKAEKWSWQLTVDYYRADIRIFLFRKFGTDKRIKTLSPARTSKTVTLLGVRSAVITKVKAWDDMDIYDGSEEAKDAIFAGILITPNRIDVSLPMRPPADLDQISVAGKVQ